MDIYVLFVTDGFRVDDSEYVGLAHYVGRGTVVGGGAECLLAGLLN